MKNFWQDLPKPYFILAPMEAVTDVVFRHVVAQAAPPDVYFSEFTNATGWVHAGEKAIGTRLIKTDDENPIVAQIWGGEPTNMAALAAHCRELGYHGIDINMGCPAKSAIKSGGAALIKMPAVAAEAIAAAKTAGLPVSVKTRLGYSDVSEWRDWLGHLLRQDIANLSIHLRTKKEMSKVPAHYELIPEIVKLRNEIAPHTLVTINGDIRDRAHGNELSKLYNVDGIMIGRGIFTNPFAFEKSSQEHSREEMMGLLRLQLDLHDKIIDQHGERHFEPLKRFFKIYIRNFDGASDLRQALMLTNSTTEARNILCTTKSHFSNIAHVKYHMKMQHHIKAIVFDSDGTLINTKKLILHGYKTVLKRHGLEHLTTDAYIRQRLGKPVPETYEQLLAGHNLNLSIDQLVIEHDEVQDSVLDLIRPYPQTEQLLHEWRTQGIKLCLFTSGNLMMIRRNFAAAGIKNVESLFDAIITADDHLPRKPEPDAINELLKRVGVTASDAVVVGDHPYDIQSGTHAKAGLTIGVLHGFGDSKELLDAGADFLSEDLLSLNTLLYFASE